MDLWSQMLLPLMSIRLPASGDVSMNYNPWTNWGWSAYDAGDPDTEDEIFTNVALPGKQLGRLNDAVTALIDLAEETHPNLEEEHPERAEAFRKFKELAYKILNRKEALDGTMKGNAKNALLRLRDLDPKAFEQLIGELYEELMKEKGTDSGS